MAAHPRDALKIDEAQMGRLKAQPKEQPLELGGIYIRQDYEGRYCLTDLHKAAGAKARHAPNHFFRLDSTQALCMEGAQCTDVCIAPFTAKKGNKAQGGGTYVERSDRPRGRAGGSQAGQTGEGYAGRYHHHRGPDCPRCVRGCPRAWGTG